ncbi:MAG: site-specific integrase [Chloroflexi bacterium]|nr:MAG: integrase domain protein SAM domain protein [Chloroflexi bacterium OLB13]MBV6434850.1 Tyrosine recombinase XerC [Anaerolineae bacterium]MCC6566734.1 site-specific integrase [Chloroflexota bacterium]MBW7878533.1 site-specific integrase [Anaerolineae bacterium]MCO6444278.1 site-specific integrase [Anaerolineae bacterium]
MSERQLPLFQKNPTSTEDFTTQTPFNATWELFADHLTAQGKSDYTTVAFTADLDLLGQHLGKGIPVGTITTRDLEGFLNWLEFGRGVPCSRKSYARRVTTLKVYFRWLHELKVIRFDPAKEILQRSGPAPLSDVLAPQQIVDCIRESHTFTFRRGKEPDTRPPMLLTLLLESGIKKGEAMKLIPANILRDNPAAPELEVRFKVRNVFKERKVAVSARWLGLYDAYMAQYHPKQEIFGCTPRNLEYVLADIGDRAGLPFKLSFEICRWTCALNDLRAGMPESEIRQKLGLSDISWYETGQKLKTLSQKLDEGRA